VASRSPRAHGLHRVSLRYRDQLAIVLHRSRVMLQFESYEKQLCLPPVRRPRLGMIRMTVGVMTKKPHQVESYWRGYRG
jgi:hypothetical protein